METWHWTDLGVSINRGPKLHPNILQYNPCLRSLPKWGPHSLDTPIWGSWTEVTRTTRSLDLLLSNFGSPQDPTRKHVGILKGSSAPPSPIGLCTTWRSQMPQNNGPISQNRLYTVGLFGGPGRYTNNTHCNPPWRLKYVDGTYLGLGATWRPKLQIPLL